MKHQKEILQPPTRAEKAEPPWQSKMIKSTADLLGKNSEGWKRFPWKKIPIFINMYE